MSNHYRNIRSSLLRFCSDFRDAMTAQGYSLSALNLDGFTDEAIWPEGDFIGLGEFVLNMTEFYEGACAMAIGTHKDRNLHRMGILMEHLVDRLLPHTRIPLLDATSGQVLGRIIVLPGVRVGAPLLTKAQPVQPLLMGFTTDLACSRGS